MAGFTYSLSTTATSHTICRANRGSARMVAQAQTRCQADKQNHGK